MMNGRKKKNNRFKEIAQHELFDGEDELETNNSENQFTDSDRNNQDQNPGATIVSMKLSSTNYLSWSRSMIRALKVKGKSDFVLKDQPIPAEDSIEYQNCSRSDNLVISWLLNAMQTEIVDSFQYASNSRELWKDLKHRYGDTNGPMIYKIRKEISQTAQGGLSILQYYNKLKKLWEELTFLSPIPSCQCGIARNCSCNAFKRITDSIEEERLMQFLLGLNDNYDHVKDQILLQDPLPSINKAYSMLLTIEKQQEISVLNQPVDIASFGKHEKKAKASNEIRYYSICNSNKHSKSKCFRVIGYPDWWKGPREPLIGSGSKFKHASIPRANAVAESSVMQEETGFHEDADAISNTNHMIQEIYKFLKGKNTSCQEPPLSTDISAFAGFSGFE